MDGREIIWQDLGTCVQVAEDAQMMFFMAFCINQEPAFWMAFLPYPQSLLWNISKSLALVYGNSIWTPQQLASFAAPHYWKIPPSQWNLVFSQLFTKTAYEERI